MKEKSIFAISLLVFSTLLFSVPLVSATHVANATLENGTHRIVPGQTAGVTLTLSINNTDISSHAISQMNFTNGTNYIVTDVTEPSGWAECEIGATQTTCTNNTDAGAIDVGSSAEFTVTVTTPGPDGGIDAWTVQTNDTADNDYSVSLSMMALDNGDIGFDIRDELGYFQTAANVSLFDEGAGLTVTTNNITDNAGDNDDTADGLMLFDDADEITGTAETTYNYTVAVHGTGFVEVYKTGTEQAYDDNGYNPVRIDLQYYIKITVQDELGTALTGATVNVTEFDEAGDSNSTITANRTDGNNYYFALDTVAFDNVTFIASKSGFINNVSDVDVLGPYYLGNNTTQITGPSPILLPFSIKLNVSDELDYIDNTGTGVTLYVNDTETSPDAQSSNFYYLNLSDSYIINVSKTGYVNTTTDAVGIPVNTTNQSLPLIQLPFTLKMGITTQLTEGLAASSASFMVNDTGATADNTSSEYVYFARDPADGDVYVNISYPGYVNNVTDGIGINYTTQGVYNYSLLYTLRVINVSDELNNTDFVINGSDTYADVDGNTTSYSDGNAYIPSANDSAVTLVAHRDSYVNTSLSVTPAATSQTWIVFNESDSTSVITSGGGLPFTVKVLGVWDELGNMSFTLSNASVNNVSIEYNASGNVTYWDGYAYVNITGVGGERNITAYMTGGLGFVNRTLNITPSNTTQKTVLFNATNQASATVLDSGLEYMIKLNVTDELSGIENMDSGVTFAFNRSSVTPNATDGTLYYFLNVTELNATGVAVENITAMKSGYVNKSNDMVRINASMQIFETAAMKFTLRVNVTNELGGMTNMNSSVTIYLNNSSVTPNSTNDNQYYFALAPQGVNITVAKSGYTNKSDTTGTPNGVALNESNQSLQSIEMPFTIRILNISDELNYTDFTIAAGDAFVDTSGIATNYSGDNIALIAAPAGSLTVTAGKNGYVNTSMTLVADETEENQTQIVFGSDVLRAGKENATGLPFSLKIMGMCDEINATCMTIDGNTSSAEFGGVVSVDNTTIYNDSIAYIPATGNGDANLTAFALGFVNMSQNIPLTPATAQVIGYFNSTYGLEYMIKIIVVNEAGGSSGMNVVDIALNNSWNPTENETFWRSSALSNIYYFNHTTVGTTDGFNVSVGKVGYINVTDTNSLEFTANNTTQADMTLYMPFIVSVTVKAQNNETMNGSQLIINSGDGSSITTFDGDYGNGTAIGTVYYPLNLAAVSFVSSFSVTAGEFRGSAANSTADDGNGYTFNSTNQSAVNITTNAPRPYNFTTYFLTADTWSRFKIVSQSQLEGVGYTATSTGDWNISTVMTDAGLGTNYDVVYYEGTTWTTYIRDDWAGSSLQYVNNTNQFDYHVNSTSSLWFIL